VKVFDAGTFTVLALYRLLFASLENGGLWSYEFLDLHYLRFFILPCAINFFYEVISEFLNLLRGAFVLILR